jgi:hypothetical protein
MKLFISWSGHLSRQLGEVVRDWIPSVLQVIRPYFTPEDVEKGSRWGTEISKELEASQAGILCVTRDNIEKPWLLFEAGALSKNLGISKVCPLLFNIDPTDISGPLTQFQVTKFEKTDMKRLMSMLNEASGDSKLLQNVFESVFEKWWPDLEQRVEAILRGPRSEGEQEVRSDKDLLREILATTRSIERTASLGGRRFGLIHPQSIMDIMDGVFLLIESLPTRGSPPTIEPKIKEVLKDMRRSLSYFIDRSEADESTREALRRVLETRFSD